MGNSYLVQDTTKLQREKYANDALSIAVLDAPMPSDFARECMQDYIDGKCELEEARRRVIDRYKVGDNA